MKRSRWRALLGTGCLAALAGTSGTKATDPPATFGETLDVELVTVDVWVTDRHGRPVTGLAASDFKVLHDGQPVTVSNFAEVRGGPSPPSAIPPAGSPTAVPAPPAEAPGTLVLYFDQLHLQPRDYPSLVGGVEKLLAASAVPPQRIIVLRQDRDLHLEVPLGSSRQALDEALQRIAGSRSTGATMESEQLMADLSLAWQESEELSGSRTRGLEAMPGGERSTVPGGAREVLSGSGSGGGGSGAAPGPDACDLFVDRIGGTVDAWVRDRNDRTGTTLRHLYQTGVILAGLPGVKTLVYLSDALETEPGAPATAAVGTMCPGQSLDFAKPEMPQSLLALTRHLNSNQVTIDALQASGLQVAHAGSAGGRSFSGGMRSSRVSSAFESAQRTSQRQGMGALADETGGKLVFNQNNIGGELEKIGREMHSYYSLAYKPPPGGTAGEHRIEVALADRSFDVRYRRGYREKDGEQRMRELLESVLYLGTTENPLDIRLGAGEVKPRGDRYVLPLHAFVPVERLAFLGPQDAPAAELRMLVMARSSASPRLEWKSRAFRILRPAGGKGAADLGIELELDRGTHVVAVGLRDQGSRTVSVVSTTLEVGGSN